MFRRQELFEPSPMIVYHLPPRSLRSDRRRPRRLLVLPLIAVPVLILLSLAGWWIAENVKGYRVWLDYNDALVERGESLDTAILEPSPVPDEKNFAAIPLLTSLVDRSGDENMEPGILSLAVERVPGLQRPDWPGKADGVYHGNAKVCRQTRLTFLIANEDNLPNEEAAEFILNALSPFAAQLTELSEGASRPFSRFPVDWSVFDPDLPHLSALQDVVVTFRTRSLVRIQAGQTDEGFEDWLTIVRIASRLDDDPLFLHLVVSGTLVSVSYQSIWELLERRSLNAEQIEMAVNVLNELDLLASAATAFRYERAYFCQTLADSDKLLELVRSFGEQDNRLFNLMVAAAPSGLYFQNAVSCGKLFDELLLSSEGVPVQRIHWEALDRSSDRIQSVRQEASLYKLSAPLASLKLDALPRLFQFQAESKVIATALALEWYFLDNGSYPRSLEEMPLRYFGSRAELPQDPITEEPLLYLLRSDGRPCVYSIGANQIDEKGIPSMDPLHGDWSFQYSLPDGYDWQEFYRKESED